MNPTKKMFSKEVIASLLFALCVFAIVKAEEYGSSSDVDGSVISGSINVGNLVGSRVSEITLNSLDDRLRRIEESLTRHSASTATMLDRILKTLDGRLPKCSPANPCLHGSRCVEKPEIGDFDCLCPVGFSGKRCEKCAAGFVQDKAGRCKPDGNIFAGMFGRYKSSSYLIGKPAKDWETARKDCQRVKGGDLASIETMEEWIFVWKNLRQLDGNGVHFLGAKGSGNSGWEWVSGQGSALHHQAWRYGKPSLPGPNCLLSLKPTGYAVTDLWVDNSCGNRNGFLCEFTTI